MNHKPRKDRKKEFDNTLMLYLTKRVFEDIGETDACNEDIIDSVGNVVKKTKNENEWAFTHFDRLILSLKHSLGEKYLKNLLQEYRWIKHIDPLFIMNADTNMDFENARKNLGIIATQMEDSSYLPSSLVHTAEYIDEDEYENFCDKVSKALTIATLLLYSLRNDNTPNSIDFEHHIIPSVEMTFNITPLDDYKKCIDYCKNHNLLDPSGITKDGLRKLSQISKCLVAGNILSRKVNKVENQSSNWEKLAKMHKHE